MLTLLPCTMQYVSAIVIRHRRRKIIASVWSTVGYRCDCDVIDIVLVPQAGRIDVCDIYYFSAYHFVTGDNGVGDIDGAVLDGAIGVLAAEERGCLFKL